MRPFSLTRRGRRQGQRQITIGLHGGAPLHSQSLTGKQAARRPPLSAGSSWWSPRSPPRSILCGIFSHLAATASEGGLIGKNLHDGPPNHACAGRRKPTPQTSPPRLPSGGVSDLKRVLDLMFFKWMFFSRVLQSSREKHTKNGVNCPRRIFFSGRRF